MSYVELREQAAKLLEATETHKDSNDRVMMLRRALIAYLFGDAALPDYMGNDR